MAQPNLWSGGAWKSLTWLDFHMLIRSIFLLCFMCKFTCYYVARMVVLLLLFIWLYASYKNGFMTVLSYVSHHVLDSR